MAQMGFFDLSDRYASLDAKRDPLVEIDACHSTTLLITARKLNP